MRKNGRPNLGYSNLFWQKLDSEQRSNMFNRQELIQEILEEPEEIEMDASTKIESDNTIQFPIDRLQLAALTPIINKINKGAVNEEARDNQVIERDPNNQHRHVDNNRNAI